MSMIKTMRFLTLALLLSNFLCLLYSAKDTPIGQIGLSASLSGSYDSRVFGVSSSLFNESRSGSNPYILSEELESEDDFILKFSPAVYFNKKISLLKLSGSAGVEIAQFVKNSNKSYVIPLTTLVIDFDDTLSKNKRFSNNAKIRFDATFDVGQQVGASILEQDLVSYTYFTSGLNFRYNHSTKFGIGAGTDYTYRHYQSGSTGPRPYSDLSNLPLHARAFYIYSEKLDLFTEYSYTVSKSHNSSSGQSLADSSSHAISFGVNGDISPKLSGIASVGYSHLNFDDAMTASQQTIISSLTLNWKYNQKTSSNFSLNRSFIPSAQGFSNLTTSAQFGVSHRFIENLTGSGYISAGFSEYTYPTSDTLEDVSSFSNYGFGFSIRKLINKFFSTSGGYDFSYIDRGSEDFVRHVLQIQMTGKF